MISSHHQAGNPTPQDPRNNNFTEDLWETKSGLIKPGAIKKNYLKRQTSYIQCPVDPKINSVFCRTLSPNPLRNDQWINSAILIPGTKHTGGLAMFIIIILTVPIQMK